MLFATVKYLVATANWRGPGFVHPRLHIPSSFTGGWEFSSETPDFLLAPFLRVLLRHTATRTSHNCRFRLWEKIKQPQDSTNRWVNLNPLNAELNSICHLLALVGAHHIFNVSRVRVKSEIPTCQEGPGGEWRYSSTLSLISAPDGGGSLTSRPGRFKPREGTRYPGCIRDRSGWLRKISSVRPPTPSDIRTPNHSARSEALQRWRYPDHVLSKNRQI